MSAAATMEEALQPLRADPARSAVLLDIDGTLAPIVRHATDAQVPERTRGLLIEIARRYRVVGCVTGRQAAVARQMVSIGTIAYSGNHGTELLRPGATRAEVDPEVAAFAGQIRAFAEGSATTALQRLRVRLEDKGTIVAFHWRGAPDESAARAALEEIAARAEREGLVVHWGRKVLEVRPPVDLDKGRAVRRMVAGAGIAVGLYVGDDTTDLDAFSGLRALEAEGLLERAVCVAVGSDEGPPELARRADLVVEGTDGVRRLLGALLA